MDEKYIDEYCLRETIQLELQRVEEENKQLKKENTELKRYNKRLRRCINEIYTISRTEEC